MVPAVQQHHLGHIFGTSRFTGTAQGGRSHPTEGFAEHPTLREGRKGGGPDP